MSSIPNVLITVNETAPSAGDIQARIDLQILARQLLGMGMPGGDCVRYFDRRDPDDFEGDLWVFPRYYRNVRTGERGGAIKLVQRVRHCRYDQAKAFLEGWFLGRSQPESGVAS